MFLMSLKNKVFLILEDDEYNTVASKIINSSIMLLIALNVLMMIFETSDTFDSMTNFFRIFELISIIIFATEYFVRVWISDMKKKSTSPFKSRVKYILSPMALIDLFAFIPFFIPSRLLRIDLRAIRLLRLFRLLKLFKSGNYSLALLRVLKVIKLKSKELISSITVVLTLLIFASALMYNIEHKAQPEVFRSMFDAMWWATATLTTVGYGDIYPITALGKLCSACIAILGIGIVAIPAGILASGFFENSEEKQIDTCPNCGLDLNNT